MSNKRLRSVLFLIENMTDMPLKVDVMFAYAGSIQADNLLPGRTRHGSLLVPPTTKGRYIINARVWTGLPHGLTAAQNCLVRAEGGQLPWKKRLRCTITGSASRSIECLLKLEPV